MSTVRVLGIDPGKRIGVALLDVGARQAVQVALGEWLGDTDEDLVSTRLLLGTWLRTHNPDLVAVERVVHVHGSSRMGSSYAEGLAWSNWVGGELAGLARALGAQVVTIAAGSWRAGLAGSRTASDAQIARAIRLRVPSWPMKSNEHQRDAAGVALAAGLVHQRGRGRAA